MPPVRALLAILIVLSHFPYYGVAGMTNLRFLAPVCVSIFLFISGYGLTISHQQKGMAYLRTFFRQRVLRIVLPAILVALLHGLLFGGVGVGPFERGRLIVTEGATLLPHYWFVWTILFDYLVFWLSCRLFRASHAKYAILLLTLAFTLATFFAGFDRCWWICSLAFPTGVFYAGYESYLYSFCAKRNINYWLILLLCALVFVSLYLSGILLLRMLCYVVLPVAAALAIAPIPLDKLKMPVLRFIGTISYEIYLIHITTMSLLRNGPFQLSSTSLYVVAVLCLSLVLAYGIHLFCRIITQKTN